MLGEFRSIHVPEFTWGNLRIDSLIIETRKRWIRGFEIKVSREDWVADHKWQLYSEFCSSLSIACPVGLIKPDEVSKPFGLLYVIENGEGYYGHKWAKRPKRFQNREALAWMWTYLRVLEAEMPRLQLENSRLRQELARASAKEGACP